MLFAQYPKKYTYRLFHCTNTPNPRRHRDFTRVFFCLLILHVGQECVGENGSGTNGRTDGGTEITAVSLQHEHRQLLVPAPLPREPGSHLPHHLGEPGSHLQAPTGTVQQTTQGLLPILPCPSSIHTTRAGQCSHTETKFSVCSSYLDHKRTPGRQGARVPGYLRANACVLLGVFGWGGWVGRARLL